MKNEIFKSEALLHNSDSISYEISKNIGNKIKKLRKLYNLTGYEFAKTIGISQAQLSRYENGVSDISPVKIMLISIYFNVDVSYFFMK